MAFVRHILAALEAIAPPEWALPGDRIGLQIGDLDANVERALVTLDRSRGAVSACRTSGVQLLLSHHPIIWKPLSELTNGSDVNARILELARAHVNFIAAHTNWDCAPGGVNDALAAKLGLSDVTHFGSAATFEALKLVTFAPVEAVDRLLDAAAKAGASTIGAYQRCAFLQKGEGTFDAPRASAPAAGEPGKRNRVPEMRLEMELPSGCRRAVEAAVRVAHPYEEPAIDFLGVQKLGVPIGRKGRLRQPLEIAQFREFVDEALGARSVAWEGRPGKIEWVSVTGGAADDEWRAALDSGCSAFVTGEVKQHNALEGSAGGINMFAAGHYATEQPGVEALAAAMQKAVPDVEWTVFVPEAGQSGRPL